MDTLTKLFGSATKVKMVKLFVFNPELAFDAVQISERVKESISKVRRELSVLDKMGLIKRKSFVKSVKRGTEKYAKVKTNGWTLSEHFMHIVPLQAFLVNMNDLSSKDIARKITRTGSIKLIIISGVFIQNVESRVDLLVVGDNIKKGMLESAIKTIESEIGKELRYAFFETADFKYRVGLYDKLIRDILDYSHEKIVNKLGLA